MVLPRKKKKSTLPGKLEITDTVQINQEVFEFIEDYKQLTSAYDSESYYLISYKAYRKYVKIKTKEKAREKMGAFQFINIIDRFYDEIVTPKYGDLERIKPGQYVKLEGYPFDNMPAEVVSINHKRKEVKVKLLMDSIIQDVTVSFENVFYSIYKNFDEENREKSIDDLNNRFGENAIQHLIIKKRLT